MVWPNSARVNVHLTDPAAVVVSEFPDSAAGPFVSVDLEPVASLLVHDLAPLDALIAQARAARDSLAGMLAGQNPLPEADALAAAEVLAQAGRGPAVAR